MKTIITAFILCMLAWPLVAQDKNKKTDKQTAQQELQAKITQAIGDKDYKISVDRAYPLRGKAINLTSPYDFAVRGDSAFAYLPYFGVSQVADYSGTDGGIKFAEPLSNYSVAFNEKKKEYLIKFEIRSPKDHYRIMLTIYTNGSASISVTPDNSDYISFSGEVVSRLPRFFRPRN